MRDFLTAAFGMLVALALIAADTKDDDAAKKDVEKLQGTWILVSAERDGKKLPDEEVKKTKIRFEGDKFVFPNTSGIGTSQKGIIEVDPSKKPKWMDSKATNDVAKGELSLGIYEIAGDDYKVCFAPPGKDRPKEFSSKPGSGHIFQVWKRGMAVELTGTIRTGVVAIGGETTGIIVETKKAKYELDFGKDKELRQKAEKFNGEIVVVAGTLAIRKGVEVGERKIITVSRLEEAKDK